MADSATTLLPCPFCGGSGEGNKHFQEPLWRFLHRCPIMGPLTIDWKSSPEDIAEMWNTRVGINDAR